MEGALPEQYRDAALRHYTDAQRLAESGAWDNAGHLIGFAAECALKHAFSLEEPSDDSPRVHLPDLAGALRKRISGRDPKYPGLWPLLTQNSGGYFADWAVSQRYDETGKVSKEKYEKWCVMATRTISAAKIRKQQDD